VCVGKGRPEPTPCFPYPVPCRHPATVCRHYPGRCFVSTHAKPHNGGLIKFHTGHADPGHNYIVSARLERRADLSTTRLENGRPYRSVHSPQTDRHIGRHRFGASRPGDRRRCAPKTRLKAVSFRQRVMSPREQPAVGRSGFFAALTMAYKVLCLAAPNDASS